MPTPPEVGSLWRNPQGEIFRVIKVTPYAVKLQSNTGVSDISGYDWPLTLSQVIEEVSPADSVITALLVGGEEGKHFDRLWEQAADVGVEISHHWPGGGYATTMPSTLPGVDLVIFLTSHLGHPAFNNVKKMLVSQPIPAAHVQSQGFQYKLRSELTRLKLEPPSGFGGLVQPADRKVYRGHYVWTGRAWTWSSASEVSLDTEASNSGIGWAMVVGVLTGLTSLL